MAKTNSLKLVPFVPVELRHWVEDEDGNGRSEVYFDGMCLLEYSYGVPGEQTGSYNKTIEWRDNEPFHAKLTIRELERGRSAARFWFEDVDNKTRYPFFGQGLVDMLSQVILVNGVVEDDWIAVRRGANYGIELYRG